MSRDKIGQTLPLRSEPLNTRAKPLEILGISESHLADRRNLQPRLGAVNFDFAEDNIWVHAHRYLAYAKQCQLPNAKLPLAHANRYIWPMKMHPISDRIFTLLTDRGMSKADLSRLSAIPYHRLNPWFVRDNAKPNAEDIERVARALDVPIEHLLNGSDSAQKPAKEWILQVYDSLNDQQRQQLEGFVRFLAQEARNNPSNEQEDPAAK